MPSRLRVVAGNTTRIVACSVPGCEERGETDMPSDLYLCQTHYAAWQFIAWCLEKFGLIAPR